MIPGILNKQQSREWIDHRLFAWHTREKSAQKSEDDYHQHLNHNGIIKPRKVTFVDSSDYYSIPEAKKSQVQESFENLKKMVGKITDWITESISDLKIKQSFQGSSFLKHYVDKVKERFSHKPQQRDDVDVDPKATDSFQKASGSDVSMTLDQNNVTKKQRFFLLENPNNNTTTNSSKIIGDHRETLDHHILAEWFIKCVNSNPTESSIKKTFQTRASLERQVSLMLASCFDKFGNLNRKSKSSSGDVEHENTDNNNKRNYDDDDNSSNKNNNSSVDENKMNQSKNHVTKENNAGAKKLPLTCSSNNSETNDVSQLVKMFDSYTPPGNSNDKIDLKEKYSNVNVKDTIKQLDLILFRKRDKAKLSRLYLRSIMPCKPEVTYKDSTQAPIENSHIDKSKEESRNHVSRTNTFRNKFKKAFNLGNVSPSPLRNRSSTLPPNRVLKFFTPARGQQVSITINEDKSSKTKKIINISRNNLEILDKDNNNDKKVTDVKVVRQKDESPSPLTQSKTKNRSKSVHPVIISPSSHHHRRRNKGCFNTEDSFNFLFHKLFINSPPFKNEFSTSMEKENQCGESTWNRIYAWELRDRLNETSRLMNDSSAHRLDNINARKRFANRSAREDNRNSSSNAMMNEVRSKNQFIGEVSS